MHAARRIAQLLAAVVFVAGCSSALATPPVLPSSMPNATATPLTGPSKTVAILAHASSGVSGTATFTDAGHGQTQIVIAVDFNLNRDMPSFVTAGSCAKVDKSVLYELNDTRDGRGMSFIPVAFEIVTGGAYEVHVDAAPDDLTIAACGDVK